MSNTVLTADILAKETMFLVDFLELGSGAYSFELCLTAEDLCDKLRVISDEKIRPALCTAAPSSKQRPVSTKAAIPAGLCFASAVKYNGIMVRVIDKLTQDAVRYQIDVWIPDNLSTSELNKIELVPVPL